MRKSIDKSDKLHESEKTKSTYYKSASLMDEHQSKRKKKADQDNTEENRKRSLKSCISRSSSDGERTDSFGNEIKKGSKKHKIAFNDKVYITILKNDPNIS
jgi:hypothetical protein